MAYICDLCGKGKMIGRQHKHHPGVAGGRWKRRAPKTQKIFKPNLHWARIALNGSTGNKAGEMTRVRLCTKCLRRAKEAMLGKQTLVVPQTASQSAAL